MSKPRVIVTRRWPEEVEAQLPEHFEVTFNRDDTPMSHEALREAFTAFDAVFPTVTDRIDAQVMAAEPLRARLIGNFGVGFNNIEIAAAKDRGLVVTNTPDRRAGEGERHVRAKAWTGWRPTHMMGTQVTGKTLGMIGLGRIGRPGGPCRLRWPGRSLLQPGGSPAWRGVSGNERAAWLRRRRPSTAARRAESVARAEPSA